MKKKGYPGMKPMIEKRFFFPLNEKLYWSPAYQRLTKAARNLMMCFVAELRFAGRGKKLEYTNNGGISFTEKEFKAQDLGCSETYLRARNLLIEVGLIKLQHRGGMTRGDRAKYRLLFVKGVFLEHQRWTRYPKENWKHEIPKVKHSIVGVKTRFKKSKPTLKNATHKDHVIPKKIEI